jgi:hypothetical protein
MSDQAVPAVKIPRYAYPLADKNWLLDYPTANKYADARMTQRVPQS